MDLTAKPTRTVGDFIQSTILEDCECVNGYNQTDDAIVASVCLTQLMDDGSESHNAMVLSCLSRVITCHCSSGIQPVFNDEPQCPQRAGVMLGANTGSG